MSDVDSQVALVDMDGTLCQFHEQLQRDLDKVLGEDRQKVSAKTIQEVEWVIRRDEGWYRNLKPIQFGFQIVRMLQDIGFRIMIMTKSSKQSKNAWSEKVAWISEHLPEADVTVTQDKSLVYGKILVDDTPAHFIPWMKHRPRGIVVMPIQPWNQSEDGSRPNLYAVSETKHLQAIRGTLEEAFKR